MPLLTPTLRSLSAALANEPNSNTEEPKEVRELQKETPVLAIKKEVKFESKYSKKPTRDTEGGIISNILLSKKKARMKLSVY